MVIFPTKTSFDEVFFLGNVRLLFNIPASILDVPGTEHTNVKAPSMNVLDADKLIDYPSRIVVDQTVALELEREQLTQG